MESQLEARRLAAMIASTPPSTSPGHTRAGASAAGAWRLYIPKSVTVPLQEGYSWTKLRADALAGLTVSIVAVPLAMAIAIASGVTPAQGLITAVVAGFPISALGGAPVQTGGPPCAFTAALSGRGAAPGSHRP